MVCDYWLQIWHKMTSLGSYLFLSESAYCARYYECNKYTIVNFTTFQAANTSISIVCDGTFLSIVAYK